MKQLIVLLLLCVPVMGQKPTKEEKASGITIKYDKFKDITRVSTLSRLYCDPAAPNRGHQSNRGLSLEVVAVHPGQTVAPPTYVLLALHSAGSFGHTINHPLTLLVDGDRLTIEATARNSSDIAFADISLHTLKELATAKTVEGQISSIEFILKREHQKVLANIVAYFTATERGSRYSSLESPIMLCSY